LDKKVSERKTDMSNYIEKFLQDPNNLRLFLEERAIHDVTDLLEAVMKEQGITRAELARRLGKTKGWVTQLLDTDANKTIRTVAGTFAVLGREYRSFAQPIQISRTSTHVSVSRVVTSAPSQVSRNAEPWTISLFADKPAASTVKAMAK
jgi:transcriptional regulator with XRE-family HTH domain